MEFEPRTELVLLLRLAVAGALAAVLGWERESAHKPAGLRTHMLVGIASALFTVLAGLSVTQFPGEGGGLRSDPIRVIQAVSIGIGIAAGLQHYVLAIGATFLLMLVLKGMRRFEDSER
jgi:putative Mg2+ transporter-C (MgtC) family protein